MPKKVMEMLLVHLKKVTEEAKKAKAKVKDLAVKRVKVKRQTKEKGMKVSLQKKTMKKAKGKQLDRVLSTNCAHLSRRASLTADGLGRGNEEIPCDVEGCDKECKSKAGLIVHRVKFHKLLDPRRAAVSVRYVCH